jgi:hypothetical protein
MVSRMACSASRWRTSVRFAQMRGPSPTSKRTTGLDVRVRANSTYGPDGSIPTAAATPTAARARVRLPVPHPTSRTCSPAWTPANSTNDGASRWLHRPMNCSYPAGSVATNVVVVVLIRSISCTLASSPISLGLVFRQSTESDGDQADAGNPSRWGRRSA